MSKFLGHLSKEHDEVLVELVKLENLLMKISKETSLESEEAEIKLFLNLIDKGIKRHFDEEEEILFPVMILSKFTNKEHITEILLEHVELYNYFNMFKKGYFTGNSQTLIEAGEKIIEVLRLHIEKEEKITLQMAKSIFGPEETDEFDQLKKMLKELKAGAVQ